MSLVTGIVLCCKVLVSCRDPTCVTICKWYFKLNALKTSLTYLLTHWHTDSLTHWLTHSLTHPLTHSLTHWLPDWLTDSLTHWLTHSLTYSPTHWLTDSLTHWLIHSFTHSLIHSFTHSLTDWLTDWLTDSLTDLRRWFFWILGRICQQTFKRIFWSFSLIIIITRWSNIYIQVVTSICSPSLLGIL